MLTLRAFIACHSTGVPRSVGTRVRILMYYKNVHTIVVSECVNEMINKSKVSVSV